MKGLSKIVAAGGTLLALAGTAVAADQISGRERPPAASAVTISATAPLFQEAGLVGGQTFERCTILTNEGPQPADVTLFGNATEANLSPWLELELVRGALPGGTPAGDCTGFVADVDDYGQGPGGVVFRGTLDTLPGADAGIADPTRWTVGERHAYLLRVHYTGTNPQQGLRTVQDFSWGVTPFDDRPPEPLVDPGQTPPGSTIAGGDAPAGPAGVLPGESSALGRSCTVITFPSRSFIGARAIGRPKQIKKKKKPAKSKKKTSTAKKKASKAGVSELGSSAGEVIAAGEDPATVGHDELDRRAELLATTRRTAARRTPVLVVRLSPQKGGKLAVRVGLRKNGKMLSPKRWKWVRVRINRSPTKSTVRWPFTASAQTKQLKVGYNQLDLTLHRGKSGQRVKGLSALMRRSFAFVVGQPGKTTPGSTDCTLG